MKNMIVYDELLFTFNLFTAFEFVFEFSKMSLMVMTHLLLFWVYQ